MHDLSFPHGHYMGMERVDLPVDVDVDCVVCMQEVQSGCIFQRAHTL